LIVAGFQSPSSMLVSRWSRIWNSREWLSNKKSKTVFHKVLCACKLNQENNQSRGQTGQLTPPPKFSCIILELKEVSVDLCFMQARNHGGGAFGALAPSRNFQNIA